MHVSFKRVSVHVKWVLNRYPKLCRESFEKKPNVILMLHTTFTLNGIIIGNENQRIWFVMECLLRWRFIV